MNGPENLDNQKQKPEVKESEFYAEHIEDYRELFAVLDMETPGSLDEMVEVTQSWVRGDHSRPMHKFSPFNDQQVAKLLELYNRFGMIAERLLPQGSYDDIVVLGATQAGNNRRLQFLRKSLEDGNVTSDRIMLLGGQRRPFEEYEKDVLEDDLSIIDEQGTDDSWTKVLKTRSIDDIWETDLMRVAAIRQLGSLTLHQLHLRIANQESVESYNFEWQGTPVILQHTLAVQRKGEARHTTEACIKDWLETYKPPYGANVAFIGAQPHLDRMGMSAQHILNTMNRQDITLTIGGSSVGNITPAFYLGEIARRF